MKDIKDFDFRKGEILLVDKPLGWSSFDVVRKLKYLLHVKIGHGGTLDPLATGLMLIGTGSCTKDLTNLTLLDKEYTGTFRIGAVTASYDRETEEENETDISSISEEDIHRAAAQFDGRMEQRPPVFSAIKVNGKRSYKSARKGTATELEPRSVEISNFEVLSIEKPFVRFRVSCSKGTYIRSLAHDFGQALGVGAYLYELRRTRIGNYRVEDAWDIKELTEQLKTQQPQKADEDL
jgi:tRNA pseudouridine55 synthase